MATTDDQLRAENVALKASLNAMFEQAVELHRDPSPLGTFEFNLGYRLGTAGHLYTCEGYVAIMEERDSIRRAADALADALELLGSTFRPAADLVAAYRARDDVSALDVFCSEPTVGYCSKCGEVRSSVYTCRDGGSTVLAAPDA